VLWGKKFKVENLEIDIKKLQEASKGEVKPETPGKTVFYVTEEVMKKIRKQAELDSEIELPTENVSEDDHAEK